MTKDDVTNIVEEKNRVVRENWQLRAEVLRLRAELDAARGCPRCGPACDLMPKEKS